MNKLFTTIAGSLITAALLVGVAAPASAKDVRRPKTSYTTADGATFYTNVPNPALESTVDGRSVDRKSGVRYVLVTFTPCTNSEGSCERSPIRETTRTKLKIRDMDCNRARTKCAWSAEVPSGTGNWRVGARTLDRAGNWSNPRTIRIDVL